MLIREVGILLSGMPILFKSYHKTTKDGISLTVRSALISGILGFVEHGVSNVQYFDSNKYVIVFKKDKINSYRSKEKEMFLAYIVMDKDKKLVIEQKHDKYIEKKILPLLQKILDEFISQYNGKDLNETSQFESFKKILDKILGTDTKTLEQKLSSLFFG